MKFHINPENGKISACKALKGGCPFGGDSQHYATKDRAQQAFELSMGAQTQTLNKSELLAASIAVRDKAFMSAFDSYGATTLNYSQVNSLIKVMGTAYSKVKGNDDSFTAAEKLANEFERSVNNENYHLDFDDDHIQTAKAAAIAFVSPRFGSASRVFEQELLVNGWDTSGEFSESSTDFQRTFAKAIHKAGASPSATDLKRAFIATIQADPSWSFDPEPAGSGHFLSTTDSIDTAANKAIIEMNKDSRAFKKEMKLLP